MVAFIMEDSSQDSLMEMVYIIITLRENGIILYTMKMEWFKILTMEMDIHLQSVLLFNKHI